ncbi:MAG: 3-phenylpropionate MFS transporter [Geminicoccaceae bacterium]
MLTPAASTALRLAFFYAAMFSTIGVFLPYWPIWLESRGLNAAEIGLIIGASFWPRVVTSLMIPNTADRLGKRRLAMTILTALTFLGLIAFGLVRDFWLFMLLSLVTGAIWASILPLGEAISLNQASRHGLDYGRVRLWGSITFILMSLGGGYALEFAGADIIYIMILTTTGITFVACLTMPEIDQRSSSVDKPSLSRLFRRKELWQVVIATAMIQASHALIYGFGTIHWRAAGHSDATIGWLWAEGVVAEVLLFMGGARLISSMSHGRLIVIAGSLTVIRWLMTGMSASLPVLVLAQALHAASFALTFLATLHYLRDTTPPELQASAQGFYTAIGFAPLFGVITPLSGWLYGTIEGAAFFVMAVLAGAGTLLAVTLPPASASGLVQSHGSHGTETNH